MRGVSRHASHVSHMTTWCIRCCFLRRGIGRETVDGRSGEGADMNPQLAMVLHLRCF